MKNVIGWIVLGLALAALVFVPAFPAAPSAVQSLVELPDDAQTLVLALVTAGVAWLLTKVDLGEYTQPLASAIAPILIAFLERLTGMIPPVFDNVVLAAIHLLVLFVSGSVGSLLFFKRIRQPKQLLQ